MPIVIESSDFLPDDDDEGPCLPQDDNEGSCLPTQSKRCRLRSKKDGCAAGGPQKAGCVASGCAAGPAGCAAGPDDSHVSPFRVLEFFSGTGSVGAAFAARGHSAISVDVSDSSFKPTHKEDI